MIPVGAPQCAELGRLFTDGPPLNGTVPDLGQLDAAASTLDAETQALVASFIEANAAPPDLETFETLVAELDATTAETCGLPIVSAWVTLRIEVETLPCWAETGVVYPAYEIIDCV